MQLATVRARQVTGGLVAVVVVVVVLTLVTGGSDRRLAIDVPRGEPRSSDPTSTSSSTSTTLEPTVVGGLAATAPVFGPQDRRVNTTPPPPLPPPPFVPPTTSTTQPIYPPGVIVLTAAHHNQIIQVQVGDQFLVELPDSGALMWLVGESDFTKVEEGITEQPLARPGFTWIHFTVVGAGSSALQLAQMNLDDFSIVAVVQLTITT